MTPKREGPKRAAQAQDWRSSSSDSVGGSQWGELVGLFMQYMMNVGALQRLSAFREQSRTVASHMTQAAIEIGALPEDGEPLGIVPVLGAILSHWLRLASGAPSPIAPPSRAAPPKVDRGPDDDRGMVEGEFREVRDEEGRVAYEPVPNPPIDDGPGEDDTGNPEEEELGRL